MISLGDIIDNRYRVNIKIGSGGMADVYEATDFVANRIVAVKIMKEGLETNPENLKSFKSEILISASLNHPNIVKIYNEGVYNNRPYIVIEYIKGQTLFDKLEYLTKFSLGEAIDIMIQLLDAMDYIHSHGLLHRDIKPQNVFYLSNGTVKLGDFGIATNEQQMSSRIIGSVGYLAPEVINGMPYSIRSDIYAAGITFFQLITGTLPFEEKTTQETALAQINKKMPKASSIIFDLPQKIDEIIIKATSKNQGERYLSAQLFKQALIDFENGVDKKEGFFQKLINKL